MKNWIFLKAFVVLQIIRVADSVLCWQCDSLNYKTCAVQTCQGNRCQTRTSLMNGQVSHMCGVPMGADGCRTTFGEKICICSGDKCNNEGIDDNGGNAGVRKTFSISVFVGSLLMLALTI